MNELMRQEILDQPEAIQRTLPSLRSQMMELFSAKLESKRLIFTGSGDSYLAAVALQYAARLYLKIDTHVLPAQEAGHYWPFTSDDLLVAISISGKAGRTLETARAARKAGAFVLAITANEDSPLTEISAAEAIIPFQSRSRKTPHTTDYLTTLLAIATIIEVFGKTKLTILDNLSNIVDQTLNSTEPDCQAIGDALLESSRFFFLGAGPSFGTVQYAAAKFWEAGGLYSFAIQLEEFAHGAHLVVDPDDPVFLVSPAGRCLDRSVEMVEGLKQIRVKIFVITDKPEKFSQVRVIATPSIDEAWSPFVTSIPVQWLCRSVATAKGYDVVLKNGRHPNPEVYERAHWYWVRGSR